MDYNFSSETKYWITCEGCGDKTRKVADAEVAANDAAGIGYVAVDTPEDGTLNFCPDCRPISVEDFERETKALTTTKRKWEDLDQLSVMTRVWDDGRSANYAVKCPVCKQRWLQYEYGYYPFDMEAYCHFCKNGIRQGKGLPRKEGMTEVSTASVQ